MPASKLKPETVTAICARLEEGDTLVGICKDMGLGRRTVYDWMGRDPAVAEQIRAAERLGEEAIEASLLEIADDGRNDWMEKQDGTVILNGENVQRSKLRIWTRMKLLAIKNPDKYGEKQTVKHDVTGNLAEQIRERRERAQRRDD